MFRFLIRFLANNERLVQKVSESYPVRRAAQFLVSLYFRGQNAIQESGAKNAGTQLKSFTQKFKNNLREEYENAKQEMQHRKK